MTQTRYTLQQHHVNLKSSVKLSHINMYHCESPASNIFPGHPYDGIFGNEIFAGRRIRFVNSRNMLLLA